MNYRHAFHAGNHADVLKHAILIACLAHLRKKPAAFAAFDTHAGIGMYDLDSDEARRSPEWRDGIGRVWDWPEAPQDVLALRDAVAAFNPGDAPQFYPGSPALIRAGLREQDRLIACELHGDDSETLKARFRGDRQAQIHARDGWEALGALLPPAERRGLVLIDPPYEAEGELTLAMEALAGAIARFESGLFIWWRPLKDSAALERADIELNQRVDRPMLRAELAVSAPTKTGKLVASSLLLVNPPYGLEDRLRAWLPPLAARLAQDAGGFWKLETA